jgi:hypothetical protein
MQPSYQNLWREPNMEMILLDWTRMGKTYCLAGVVVQDNAYRVVRPLQGRYRDAPVRNVGWSPYQMDGHCRWEVFELMGAEPALNMPPHLEDIWVRELRSRKTLAPLVHRQRILQATLTAAGDPYFGAPLTSTPTAAFLTPGTGQRSLASVVVAASRIAFTASQREGADVPDYRVTIDLPGLEERTLPLKDHFLIQRGELASTTLPGRIRAMTLALNQLGQEVIVRLGLSRPFQAGPEQGPRACWLMVDGLFSPNNPQP